MSRCSCPIACPLAWSSQRDTTCTRVGFGRVVPANVFSLFSPAHLHPHACSSVRHHPPNPSFARQESAPNERDFTGEVSSCPVVGPFGWPKAAHSSLTAPTVVPAKENKKKGPAAAKGGGL
jgi:hypothetical protein